MGKKGKKARRQGLASSQPPPPSSESEVDYKPKNPFDYIDVDDACTKFAKMSVGGDTACFICLEGHQEGQPLLRDCSCRGSSGWAHFECLIKYAEQKSDTLLKKGRYTPDEMKNIWGLCYNCKQDFQDDLCVGMAAGYVCFIENQPLYSRKDWDVLESLKYMQRTHSAHNHAQNINVEEGKLVSRRILSLLEKYNASNYSGPRIFPQRLLELEADTYRVLGSFCFCEKDYDDVIEYNEKAIALYKELSEKFDERKYTIMIADSQSFIQSARKMTKSPEGENKCTDPELEQQKVLYDTILKEDGEITAIYQGLNYSEALFKSGYRIKAQRLTRKLLLVSQRVHGPNHSLTERASRYVIHERYRGMVFNDNHYAFMKFNKAKNKYVVRGPLEAGNFEHIRDETIGKKSLVSITSCRLCRRTPVYIHGLEAPQEHFNGKIGENLEDDTLLAVIGNDKRVMSYNIRFEDGNTLRVSPANIRILFDVPEGDRV